MGCYKLIYETKEEIMKKRTAPKYKCKTHGCVRIGNLSGICGKVRFGPEGYCGAHGNTKCVNKIKITEVE